MPTADGPCRFGQYAPYIRKVLRDLGLTEVSVFAPNSRDGYQGIGVKANDLMRNALRGLVCTDILRKMLHRIRPYELHRGDADVVHTRAVQAIGRVLERQGVRLEARMRQLEAALGEARNEFLRVPTHFSRGRRFIGVVGEIFCRLTPFTNESIIRKIEDLGGECTLAHIVEWVWYTNREHQNRLRRQRRTFSTAMVTAKLSDHLQHKDEHRLYQVFAAEFLGYEEPPVHEILGYSEPYLPAIGALGEMTLSVGKAVFHHHQGCDGVVDVAPFTCMNGIVTEAIYPRVSADHDDMPIRNLFFDGPRPEVERDLGVFMELARAYRARKKVQRTYPPGFPESVSMEP
jgi:predicted nucleotide-binding protein (sugar kinase/HSP70/actin superfamily)